MCSVNEFLDRFNFQRMLVNVVFNGMDGLLDCAPQTFLAHTIILDKGLLLCAYALNRVTISIPEILLIRNG